MDPVDPEDMPLADVVVPAVGSELTEAELQSLFDCNYRLLPWNLIQPTFNQAAHQEKRRRARKAISAKVDWNATQRPPVETPALPPPASPGPTAVPPPRAV